MVPQDTLVVYQDMYNRDELLFKFSATVEQ